MIILLPPEAKKYLKEEENLKLYITLFLLILIFLVSLSLILFSLKNFISGELDSQKIIYQQEQKEFENPQRQKLQSNLISFNEQFIEINNFYKKQFSSADLLIKITDLVPPGIKLDNLSISKADSKNQEVSCSISGFSPDRDILIEFKDNLESDESIKDINFPPSNWVKPTDISFSINFKIE